MRHDFEQHETRVVVATVYQGNNLPPPYQSLCFWPTSNKVLNSDIIQYNSIDGVDINGNDFSYEDKFLQETDNKRDVKETELAVRSVPPLDDKIPIGVLEFEMSLKSKIFPKIGLFNFSLAFVCDRNIFDPKSIKSTNVWFHQDAGLNLIGNVLNVYRGTFWRNDNWFQLRFSQLIEILDPKVEIKFGIQINKAKIGFQSGATMDITYIVSWINSLTTFQNVDGEAGGSAAGLAALRATCDQPPDDSPSSSCGTLVLDIVDYRV